MKKKTVIILATIAIIILAIAAIFLYGRSRVATIIDDEAAWDLRDASPQKRVIIMKDGVIARYVGELVHAKGYLPETYRCRGYGDGWSSIEINGNTGYVREEYVYWDVIDSF